MQRVESLHTFTMKAAFAHDDEGTEHSTPQNVKDVMERAKSIFPGVLTIRSLTRAVQEVLASKGIDDKQILLATSFCGDEVNRDIEDELRTVYGGNFTMGGIAGFPFSGMTGFGALGHHIPVDGGGTLLVYGPHVGIDWDGVVGKVNRRGHHGSGACCNTALASLEYVKAVRSGQTIHSPDPSDPLDAQQVFVDNALLLHGERLENAENPAVELPHALFDCQDEMMTRLMKKCCADFPQGSKILLLGGIVVNTPEGTPEYFLPKKFELRDTQGALVEEMLEELMKEGTKDLKTIYLDKKKKENERKQKDLEAKRAEKMSTMIDITIKP